MTCSDLSKLHISTSAACLPSRHQRQAEGGASRGDHPERQQSPNAATPGCPSSRASKQERRASKGDPPLAPSAYTATRLHCHTPPAMCVWLQPSTHACGRRVPLQHRKLWGGPAAAAPAAATRGGGGRGRQRRGRNGGADGCTRAAQQLLRGPHPLRLSLCLCLRHSGRTRAPRQGDTPAPNARLASCLGMWGMLMRVGQRDMARAGGRRSVGVVAAVRAYGGWWRVRAGHHCCHRPSSGSRLSGWGVPIVPQRWPCCMPRGRSWQGGVACACRPRWVRQWWLQVGCCSGWGCAGGGSRGLQEGGAAGGRGRRAGAAVRGPVVVLTQARGCSAAGGRQAEQRGTCVGCAGAPSADGEGRGGRGRRRLRGSGGCCIDTHPVRA